MAISGNGARSSARHRAGIARASARRSSHKTRQMPWRLSMKWRNKLMAASISAKPMAWQNQQLAAKNQSKTAAAAHVAQRNRQLAAASAGASGGNGAMAINGGVISALKSRNENLAQWQCEMASSYQSIINKRYQCQRINISSYGIIGESVWLESWQRKMACWQYQ